MVIKGYNDKFSENSTSKLITCYEYVDLILLIKMDFASKILDMRKKVVHVCKAVHGPFKMYWYQYTHISSYYT